jgi:hypothetical protein
MRVTEESMWRGHRRRCAWAAASPTSRTRSSGTSAAGGGSGSSRTTPGTGSARRCTSRRTCPTTASRQGAQAVEGLALAVEPMVTLGSPTRTARRRQWTVVTDDGSLAAALREHVHADRPVPGCSPRSTAGRASSRSSACRTAAPDRAHPRRSPRYVDEHPLPTTRTSWEARGTSWEGVASD